MRCGACGARLTEGATWCSQCFAPAAAPLDIPAQPSWQPLPVPALSSERATAPESSWVPADTRSSREHAASGDRPPALAPRIGMPVAEPPRVVAVAANRGMSRRALGMTVAAIVLGGVLQLVMYELSKDGHRSVESLVRMDLVLVITFYAAVLLLLDRQGRLTRLTWHHGKPIGSALIGLVCGGALAAVLVAVNSAAAGRLTTDKNVLLLVSEGDIAHIAAAILISMVAAPVVEEILFRGSLAQSFLDEGKRRTAMWVSAIAFAVWHFNPSALRYYALMGMLFFALYRRGGLVRSMAAHCAFNGTLTVVAILLTFRPGPTIHVAGASVATPAGWHLASKQEAAGAPAGGAGTVVIGPSASQLLVATQDLPRAITAATLEPLIQSSPFLAGSELTSDGVQQITVSGYDALTFTVHRTEGDDRVVFVVEGRRIIYFEMGDRGSAKARSQFEWILAHARL
jgi:membrane protease YdiL (CAAX protease family)